MDIIEIKDLCFTYPGTDVPTLKHINLSISKGDFLAIVGNNGCGKSTFCKVLNGLIPHFISGQFVGSVLVDGIETVNADVGILAKKVGYVYQDFENQIVRPTVLDDASYACMNYGMQDYKERGLEALKLCGLKERAAEYIWQLSGGQTHLLALAGAVALGPDILILDEPIAQLDPKHADSIYEILKMLNETLNKTIIVIEHHTEYIANYCKHVLLLKNGNVAWMLPTKEALNKVEELEANFIFPPQVTQAGYYLKQMHQWKPDMALPITLDEGKKCFEDFYYKEKERKPVLNINPKETIIELKDISVSYQTVKGNVRDVFDNLNVKIHKQDKIAIIGSNGAGKSTLMKLIVGMLHPKQGEIQINGKGLRDVRPEVLSKNLSLVYQNPEEMFIKDTIYNDIAYAMQVRNVKNWRQHTEDLLERFRLTELAEKDGRLLSGGQMRRASLAIGVALNPQVLLLDEPTANLDIATRKEIIRTLNDLKEITNTVLIATHDMQLVCEWANRILVLHNGSIVADGSRDDIFGDKDLMEMVGIRPPEIFTIGQMLDKQAFCYTVEEFVQGFKRRREEYAI